MAAKIPKGAKLVFKGKIFDVYQWEQLMFDGSYTTFERLRRPYTVSILATFKGKVVLTQEEQPASAKRENHLFAGRMEKGESPIKAAKRELLEESGMVSNNWHLLKVFEPVSKMDWKVYLFSAANCRKISGQNLDNGERIKVKKVSFEKFMSLSHSLGCGFDNYISEINESKKARSKFKRLLFGQKA